MRLLTWNLNGRRHIERQAAAVAASAISSLQELTCNSVPHCALAVASITAFCSRNLRVRRCEYLHTVREQGLSDHSALELEFEF